ncbi:DUF4349 domain-containing protein [Anaerocolumna xylanovorans]|uniref:DUF4349 domain-containing protein n=1 Tax=Anaerocolumna xylanovorans DSM 12503 TaxID=1121345 RepID=A0A1M7YCG6_9FIRM|nr:DUF4349 domain-containing protein [Anaerocolumna xylanovorans]SHO50291.1 protein of unknown function [Anaerocolumna xylanovorans DSM 12503]
MKKRRILYSFLMAVVLILTACSSGKEEMKFTSESRSEQKADTGSGDSYGYTAETTSEGPAAAEELKDSGTLGGETSSNTSANSADSGRKRIRRISLELETVEFDGALKVITEEMQKAGGYVESSSINGNRTTNNSSRSAQYTLRIPIDKTDGFVKMMGDSMTLIHQEENSKDVTLEYVDTESKVKTLQIEQERLLALLEKSDNIDAIISLEDRLSDVRYELEQNASALRTYDNLIDYATITLYVSEVERITQVESKGTGSRMKTGLMNSLLTMRDGFVELAVWFVVNLPYILFWGVVIGLSAWIFVRKFYRKDKKKFPASKVNTANEKKEEDNQKD